MNRDEIHIRAEVDGDLGPIVATVITQTDEEAADRMAFLFASAPSLLAALEAFVNTCDHLTAGEMDRLGFIEDWRQARAAIAQAGRSAPGAREES